MSILDQLDSNMPVGTKFLVEIEVAKEGGYGEFLKNLMIPIESDKFIEQNGCRINKVFNKEVMIDDDNLSAKELLEKALSKMNQGNT